MTTSEAPRFTSDVFVAGGEFSLPRPEHTPEPVAALSFVSPVTSDLREARRASLRRALEVATAPKTGRARLLVTYAWEPDSVRTRTTSPLQALAKKEITFPSADYREVLVAEPKGLKWSAEVVVDTAETSQIESAMFESSHAALVLGADDSIIHGFLDEHWGESADARVFLRDTALIAARRGLLVVRLFGAFDDREVSADVIGHPVTVLRLRG